MLSEFIIPGGGAVGFLDEIQVGRQSLRNVPNRIRESSPAQVIRQAFRQRHSLEALELTRQAQHILVHGLGAALSPGQPVIQGSRQGHNVGADDIAARFALQDIGDFADKQIRP